MSQKIIVVAAVVDVRQLTLYVKDGSTIFIQQGDPRLRKIVEAVTPQLIAQNWAEVTIGPAEENSYAQFEQEGSGAVKFFRIAKAKLKNLFSEKVPKPVVTTTPVPVLSIGQIPQPTPVTQASPAALAAVATVYEKAEVKDGSDDQEETFEPVLTPQPAKLEQAMSAIDEIMLHAVPVSDPAFHENDVAKQGNVVETTGQTIKTHSDNEDSPDTIIAVVDGNKIVPGMERIKTQFSRAAKMGSTQGVENFLRRLSSVIEERSHSVDDLLRFMERGDLPIADDGSILIYKVLKRSGGRTDGKYVDCHTRKVEQWTGAYVCMDPSLVDRDRRNECSNGLHVARRGYIYGFSGDVCVLAKLAPEDVIAVPTYDANKMRVCGYHILAELTDDQYNELRQNSPITNTAEGQRLLADAIAGKHVRRTHEVRITASQGGGIQVKALAMVEAPEPVVTPDAPVAITALENLTSEMLDTATDPKEVVKAVEKERLTRKEQAQKLYNDYIGLLEPLKNGEASQLDVDYALHLLLEFKKAAKVGWDKLGVADPAGAAKQPAKSLPKPAGKVQPKKTKKERKAVAKAQAKQTTKPVPKLKPVPQVAVVELEGEDKRGLVYDSPAPTGGHEGSARERIAKLMAIGLGSTGIAQSILSIKKASKKSWTILGVKDTDVEKIMHLVGEK